MVAEVVFVGDVVVSVDVEVLLVDNDEEPVVLIVVAFVLDVAAEIVVDDWAAVVDGLKSLSLPLHISLIKQSGRVTAKVMVIMAAATKLPITQHFLVKNSDVFLT